METPYLSANPEYSHLLNGGVKDVRPKQDGEYFSIFFSNRFGRVIFESSELEVKSLPSTDLSISLPARKDWNFAGYFSYLYRVRNQSFRVTTRVSLTKTWNRKGTMLTLGTRGSNAQYPAIVKSSRRRVRSQGYLRAPRVKVPRGSNLRPSPESRTLPYLGIVENDTSGVYGIAVIPKSRFFYSRTWTGVRTPGFGKLRKKQLPVNPHTVDLEVVSDDVLASYQVFNTSGRFAGLVDRYTLHYGGPPLPVHDLRARNKAIRKLVDNAQLGINANLAQDIAQIGQTTRLIANTATSLAGSLTALKGGNIPKAAKILFGTNNPRYKKGSQPSASQSLSSNWLAMQYGWKPLLQDIHGSFEALESFNDSGLFVSVATASATQESLEAVDVMLQGAPAIRGGSMFIRSKTSCRFTLRYMIDDPLKSFLAQTGFTNPVNLAWEILPFSFVIDWFLPIGPFLEGLSSWDGLKFVGGSQTLFTRQVTDSAVSYHGPSQFDPAAITLHVGGRYHKEHVKLNRSILADFPSQTFPSFKNGLASVDHALNAVALLKTVFR